MLVTLLLFAHMLSGHARMAAYLSPVPREVAHRLHVEHERHLAHLRSLRGADREPDRDGDDTSSRKVYPPIPVDVTAYSGHLGCGGLEALWDHAGGNPGSAFTAAEIAMAESGGNQFATGAAGERGYWQINPDHGALSTYDPYGNARAAIIISDDGRNWSPWTTFTHGLYIGRCLH